MAIHRSPISHSIRAAPALLLLHTGAMAAAEPPPAVSTKASAGAVRKAPHVLTESPPKVEGRLREVPELDEDDANAAVPRKRDGTWFYSADANTTWSVMVDSEVCLTPCSLRLRPGMRHITISGSSTFTQDIRVDEVGPLSIRIEQADSGYYAAGGALLVSMAINAVAGTLVLYYLNSKDSTTQAIAGTCYGLGLVFGIGGLAAFGGAGSDHLVPLRSERPRLERRSATMPSGLKRLGLGITPLPGAGAMAGVSLVF